MLLQLFVLRYESIISFNYYTGALKLPQPTDLLFSIPLMSLESSVVGQLGVILKAFFYAESESRYKISPSRQDIEIFEVI